MSSKDLAVHFTLFPVYSYGIKRSVKGSSSGIKSMLLLLLPQYGMNAFRIFYDDDLSWPRVYRRAIWEEG